MHTSKSASTTNSNHSIRDSALQRFLIKFNSSFPNMFMPIGRGAAFAILSFYLSCCILCQGMVIRPHPRQLSPPPIGYSIIAPAKVPPNSTLPVTVIITRAETPFDLNLEIVRLNHVSSEPAISLANQTLTGL